MIKEKLYSHKIFLLYGAMFVVLLICHLGIDLSYGDDGFFVNVLDDISLKEFLRNRYLWTTSRVVIEAIQMPLTVYAQWLWRILNSAVLVSIVWLINRLFAPKQTVRGILCCAALAAVVPLTAIMGAGWIATTANYVWTLAAGMTALLPIKKWIEEKDVRWWEYFIYLSAVIYATNHEQMAALLLGWYFVLGFYLMYEHKIKWQYFMLLAIAGNAVDFISKCPGNQWRKINDMQRYLPEFEKFSLTDKLFLGGLTTGHYYWTGKDGNWVMAVVCAVVLSAVIWKNRNSLKKWKTVVKIAITALPFVFHVLVGHLLKLLFHKGLLHKGLFWLGLFFGMISCRMNPLIQKNMLYLK